MAKMWLSMGCFNTQPPEGGWDNRAKWHITDGLFQHTAARRRLGNSHHSSLLHINGFNTQPPEGGWRCGFTVFW